MIDKETVAPIYSSKNTSIRLHVDNPHTYFGVPHNTTSSFEFISQINDCDYREEIYYLNYSSKPVTIINRNGLAVTIQEKVSLASRDVIIRKIIYFNNYSLKSAISAIQMNTEIDDVELVEIKKAFSSLDNPSINKASVMIDYNVSKDDLLQKGNTIYHYQTDLLITYNGNTSHADHPYCSRFINIGAFGITHEYPNQKELNFKIRYVSHENNAQPLYLNILGKIHLIKPQRDSPVKSIRAKDNAGKFYNKTFQNYIQIFYNSQSDPDLIDPTGVTYVKYTLEDAKLKFGLYDSYAEATNSKSSDILRKEELLKISHQLEMAKHQNNLDKIKAETDLENIKNENSLKKQELDKEALVIKARQSVLDTEMLALDNQKRILDMSKRQAEETLDRESKRLDEMMRRMRAEHEEALKQEAQRVKETYENRQHARRDAIDFIKFIPATVIGIGAIAALVIKLKDKKA
jgi:ElaB/YqjD/DUF883 family membrane-anchored ribosome-binding protein